MNIMRFVFSNLLLYFALGACFKFTDAQVTTEPDAHITSPFTNVNTVGQMLSSATVGGMLSSESTIAGIVTELVTEPGLAHPKTTPDHQMSTMPEEPTTVNHVPLSTQTEFAPEITTPAEVEQTTMITTNAPMWIVPTTVAEQITTDAPSTHQDVTTVGFTSELTIPTEHPTDEITTAAVQVATDSTALDPTSITSQPPAGWTAPLPDLGETSTITSTATLTSSSESEVTSEGRLDLRFDDESVSTQFTTVPGVIFEGSTGPIETKWILIIIVCVIIICALCVGMILLVQRRKKKASQTFGPVFVNGQSKRPKKKKGAGDDAWAGPVNMEEGLECDPEVQDGLLPDDGKKDGDEMVLSTFAALDEGDMSNGGVGGEGTKEAKKWEQQEPLLYIDEDADGKTLAENKTQEGDEKSKEKELNGGETFCLTTAV
ncbi:hyphal wall protein 1 [Megalobrama amblycephala]|uniref:hyphal wall protein 1 n=1 Tax=Megalobrama amblycephala TaxID=75352 RepID=UPI00201410F8|nr:hyphal wall protein 1 [Megalobrama amblycephala]